MKVMEVKMNIQLEIDKLKRSRLMRDNEEFLTFENALAIITRTNDISHVKDLCEVLDDGTEHHEVMWGVIHAIEYLSKSSLENGLELQVKCIPNMLLKAREWVDIIHFRILNHDEVRKVYRLVLAKLDLKLRDTIIDYLEVLKIENPEFQLVVNELY